MADNWYLVLELDIDDPNPARGGAPSRAKSRKRENSGHSTHRIS
jgi:hypothetical protein